METQASDQIADVEAGILLNGKPAKIRPGSTVSELLEMLRLRPERVAVEVNGEIVRKPSYGSFAIPAGARLELVSFVGGG